MQWTLFGPDLHFGVHDKVSVGIMTTWIAYPVIGSFKYAGRIGPKTTYAFGLLAGTTIWSPGDFVMLVPYSALSFGDHSSNISFSVGYGYARVDEDSGTQFLFSVGSMKKITRSGTLVFDSLLLTVEDDIAVVVVPGIRLQTKEKSAF